MTERPRKFLADAKDAVKVYPTARPEEAVVKDAAPQTSKQEAISAVGLDPETVKRLGRVARGKKR